MVGSKDGVSGVNRDIVEILSHSGLMKKRYCGSGVFTAIHSETIRSHISTNVYSRVFI